MSGEHAAAGAIPAIAPPPDQAIDQPTRRGSRLPDLRGAIPGIRWPALPGCEAADLLAQLYQFEQSQWWPAQKLREAQYRQFALLARHVHRHSPFFRARLDDVGLSPAHAWSPESFARIPLLGRSDLLLRADDIHCRVVPAEHGAVKEIQTSGSTGQTVAVRRTGLSGLMWQALTMRDHLWQGRDFSASLAVIRALVTTLDDPVQSQRTGWGPPATLLFDTGPCYAQPLSMDVHSQADWLLARNPHYLLTYPTNLRALLERFERLGRIPPGLREVRTVGETLTPDLRERCREVLGAGLVDVYSSQEVGVIALQCPVSGLYHLQSESLLAEVLGDMGEPCRPGEVGGVVVTDLHNFATPIIRYDIGDYAEAGPACPCGRGLPTLARILGRQRNMIVLPDGRRSWGMVGLHKFRDIALILQYQLIQHSLEDVELRLVTPAALTPEQESRLVGVIHKAMGHPFRLRFSYFEGELPGTRGGKFEEVVSLVAAQA
ncbi:MAG: phenylacetate--CoA ligase family protein [Burkholderiales bacterium]